MSVGFMMCSAVVFCSFPHFLVSLFTKDLTLVKICVPVLFIVSIFQIFDGLQVALAGIYKGIKKTKIVLIANFVGYWLISIPFGYWLALKHGFLLRGFWFGLLFAAVILCSLMLLMLFRYFRKLKLEFVK